MIRQGCHASSEGFAALLNEQEAPPHPREGALPKLAAELVRLRVDALVAEGTPAIQAAANRIDFHFERSETSARSDARPSACYCWT
jgi:hypothetical protein